MVDTTAAAATNDDAPPALNLTTDQHPTRRGIPTLSYIFAGAGLASLGAGALLTVWGRSDTNKLGVCSPSCPQSSADHIHNLYVAADVSIGVGLAALAASYWAYAHARANGEAQEQEHEAQTALRTPTPMIGVQPMSSGALGTLSGIF